MSVLCVCFPLVSKVLISMLCEAEAREVMDGVAEDVRIDGRSRTQWRPFTVARGVIPFAQGSASFTQDRTHVIVGITCNIIEVAESDPQRGQLQIHVDCSPCASEFLFGSGMTADKRRRAFASLVGHTLGQAFCASLAESVDTATQLLDDQPIARVDAVSCGVPFEQLYLGEGYAIALLADVSILCCDGLTVVSAASIALKAAMDGAKLPEAVFTKKTDGSVAIDVDYENTTRRLRAGNAPIILAMQLGNGHYVVDPSREEESVFSSTFFVGTCGDGSVCYASLAYNSRGTVQSAISTADLLVLLEEGAATTVAVHSYLAEQLSES